MTSPSKLKQSYTVSEEEEEEEEELEYIPTPTRSQPEPFDLQAHTEPPAARRLPSPPKPDFSISAAARSPNMFASPLSTQDNLSRLPPQLLHSMREAFSVLDSNSTGSIDAASVVETLQSLGLQESNIGQFFPPGQSQQLTLPQYLNQLANILVGLSPQQELLNAFSAFDDDDSGQIDIAELRDALLNTPPEAGERPLSERDIDRAIEGFTGRRTLGRNAVGIAGVRGLNNPATKKNGDTFRYQEFVANLTGGPSMEQQGQVVPAR